MKITYRLIKASFPSIISNYSFSQSSVERYLKFSVINMNLLIRLLLIPFFCLIFESAFSMNETIETQKNDKYTTLCYLWNTLRFVNSDVNDWDSLLIKGIDNNESPEALISTFCDKIDKGQIDQEINLKNNFSKFSWIEKDINLSTSQKQKIYYTLNHHLFYNSTLIFRDSKDVIRIKEENLNLKLENINCQILTLFRVYGIIYYVSPYYSDSVNWDANLETFLDSILKSKLSSTDFTIMLSEFLSNLHEGHTLVFSKDKFAITGKKYLLPFNLIESNNNYIIQSSDSKENLFKIGDTLLSINGIPVIEIARVLFNMCPGFSDYTRELTVNRLLNKTSNEINKLTFVKNKLPIELIVKGEEYNRKKDNKIKPKSNFYINDTILYINPSVCKKNKSKHLLSFKQTSNLSCIVIDLREYPIPDTDIADIYYERLGKVRMRDEYWKSIDLDNLGKDYFSLKTNKISKKTDQPRFQGKVFILVDGKTLSYGEILTLLIKDYANATIIGNHTNGAIGAMAFIVLPDGSTFSLTLERFATANKLYFDEVPLDIVLELDPLEYLNSNDAFLDKAITLILQK